MASLQHSSAIADIQCHCLALGSLEFECTTRVRAVRKGVALIPSLVYCKFDLETRDGLGICRSIPPAMQLILVRFCRNLWRDQSVELEFGSLSASGAID